jgi:hypothetical protein
LPLVETVDEGRPSPIIPRRIEPTPGMVIVRSKLFWIVSSARA